MFEVSNSANAEVLTKLAVKANSNNKIWGLIALFIATKKTKAIEKNLTYTTESDLLSEILQDLFLQERPCVKN